MAELSPFVASVSTRIARRAADYAAEIDRGGHPERDLLDIFNTHVEAVLAEYNPPGVRRAVEGLVFDHLYTAARHPARDEEGWRVPSALLAALVAAEVEFRGPLRLSAIQSTVLAEVYERLGPRLSRAKLPSHAVLCYRRAMALYRMNEDVDGEDRCGLELARARTRTHPRGPRRWAGHISDVLCGYGYRPFWLLGWVAAQLVIFTATGLLLAGNASTAETVYMCVTSFLNPLGPGDTQNLHAAARPLFAVESWAGTVSMSVFFALLVRKWFRM
ncbi:hypothetical protein NDR87_12150 [Nocardia sp. CDC159]|uniref:Uncharacterized protein n=1 Tax=Nocardia pulmonis TaxID=2951408 RepID=A0A9X2E4S6_9NOCA|nr:MULTISPECIES: hypothetical protein [Nocardia]MCM6774224.1 hypothetical protein [Nocardia pulmonis]MCM6787111.1 hypothetical protein [Nocardia sp. CDC159]